MTIEDLRRISDVASDIDDGEVMAVAWDENGPSSGIAGECAPAVGGDREPRCTPFGTIRYQRSTDHPPTREERRAVGQSPGNHR